MTWIAEQVPCSVVFCRRYEPVAMAWLRYRVKRMGDAYDHECWSGVIYLP